MLALRAAGVLIPGPQRWLAPPLEPIFRLLLALVLSVVLGAAAGIVLGNCCGTQGGYSLASAGLDDDYVESYNRHVLGKPCPAPADWNCATGQR